MFGDSDLRNVKFCQLHLKYLIKTLHKPMFNKEKVHKKKVKKN